MPSVISLYHPARLKGVQAERADQFRDGVGHVLEAHRPVGGRRAPVRLQVHAEHPAPGRQRLQVGAEHVGGAEATMQHDERRTAAEVLVTKLHSVYGRDHRIKRPPELERSP